MLEKRGAVMETARHVSRILDKAGIEGAVIGGIAVVLHGHVRTTKDVDVFVRGPLENCRTAFEEAGIAYDAKGREFVSEGVPVHLVPEAMVAPAPRQFTEIEGVTTVRLADLINMKLKSGMANLARAQDIADVIGLIGVHKLGHSFARTLDRNVRGDFKKLVDAVRSQ